VDSGQSTRIIIINPVKDMKQLLTLRKYVCFENLSNPLG